MDWEPRAIGRRTSHSIRIYACPNEREGPLHAYFLLSTEIEQAKADRDYARAIKAARATYPMLAAVIDAWVREYGSFNIITSHAVHTSGTLMAIMGERDGNEELRKALSAIPELAVWRPAADEALRDLRLVESILVVRRCDPPILASV